VTLDIFTIVNKIFSLYSILKEGGARMSMAQDIRKSGNIIDVIKGDIFQGTIIIREGRIHEIVREKVNSSNYILPGFIDSHIHIESSMLTPSEFARAASVHGTISVVGDPHEIANVLGLDGILWLIENGNNTPFKFFYSAPSCVPASTFEESGHVLGIEELKLLLSHEKVKALGEMMDFQGVLTNNKDILDKISLAKELNKPIDGHAPGLTGDDLKKYINTGILTDHESFTLEEALEKRNLGMKILVREGSAAKNFDALLPILKLHPNECMFASDDMHPDQLILGHINLLVKRAIKSGVNIMDVLRIASVNPIKHYNLDVGLLQPGDWADFIIVDNLNDLTILEVYSNGNLIAKDGTTLINRVEAKAINNFSLKKVNIEVYKIEDKKKDIRVIEIVEDQLITKELKIKPKIFEGKLVSDIDRDIIKIVAIDRYRKNTSFTGFIKNVGLKSGAFASSVSHDSHNIIAVGVDDESIAKAVQLIINEKGGLSAVDGDKGISLPLPIGGLISTKPVEEVAQMYQEIDKMVKKLGTTLNSPFMTISFMSLLVIPKLKISPKGLFDGSSFKYVDLYFCTFE
jgi:adenine deaminase